MAKMLSIEAIGGAADSAAVEGESLEFFDSLSERGRDLCIKEEAVDFRNDDVAAATFGVGDNWAASSESLDSGDAERLEAGKEVGFRILEVLGELIGSSPGEEFNMARTSGELDKILMLGAVTNDEERGL